MSSYHILVILMTLTAIFAYLNGRYLRLPMAIGLMLTSLFVSLLVLALGMFGVPVGGYTSNLVRGIDFSTLLLDQMLAFLLFAGALCVNLDDLAAQKREIIILSTLGVVVSTILVGAGLYGFAVLTHLELRFIDCLLFGALISPTDPIAVLGILKMAGAPKSLETKMTGESLFNDGIGVVIFLVILDIASKQGHLSATKVGTLFVTEAIGGAVFGLIAGYIAYRALRSIDDYQVEIFITLALVMGGYTGALALHISAPIAIVVAGLLIGNHGRRFAMSDRTREHIDTFWELIDEILNALLFVLIGLEVLVLTLKGQYLLAGLVAVPITLLARFISVGVPISLLRKLRTFSPKAVRIMTWGGLRGGISVALALSIPEACNRELILTMTYIVVAFSILVQGLTLKRLIT